MAGRPAAEGVTEAARPKRRRSRRPPSRSSRPPSRAPRRRRGLLAGVLAGAALLGALFVFVRWARAPGPGSGRRVTIDIPKDPTGFDLMGKLVEEGMLRRSFPFSLYFRLFTQGLSPGRHVLRDDLGPRALAQRLSRSPSRATRKVTIPEGWNHKQIAARLADMEVCDGPDFEAAVFDAALRGELGVLGPSFEGYLFPATYELTVDTEPENVIRLLASETRKRLARLSAERPQALAALAEKDGFGEHEILTLASVVERESGDPKEDAVIASVFFNRLRDPDFRPLRSLQSDPTAAYGGIL